MSADLYQLVSADVSSVHKTRISLVDCLKRLFLLLVLSTFVPICCPTSLVFVRAPATHLGYLRAMLHTKVSHNMSSGVAMLATEI